jgi:hypothetical protein
MKPLSLNRAIIIDMLKFSKSYPDKVTHHEPAAGAPAGL